MWRKLIRNRRDAKQVNWIHDRDCDFVRVKKGMEEEGQPSS